MKENKTYEYVKEHSRMKLSKNERKKQQNSKKYIE